LRERDDSLVERGRKGLSPRRTDKRQKDYAGEGGEEKKLNASCLGKKGKKRSPRGKTERAAARLVLVGTSLTRN